MCPYLLLRKTARGVTDSSPLSLKESWTSGCRDEFSYPVIALFTTHPFPYLASTGPGRHSPYPSLTLRPLQNSVTSDVDKGVSQGSLSETPRRSVQPGVVTLRIQVVSGGQDRTGFSSSREYEFLAELRLSLEHSNREQQSLPVFGLPGIEDKT